MYRLLQYSYGLFLFALIFLGVESFGFFILYDLGHIDTLLSQDKSYVSSLILVVYLLANCHFIIGCWVMCRNFMQMKYFCSKQEKDAFSHNKSVIAQYVNSLSEKLQSEARDVPRASPILLEVLDTRLRSLYAFGFIVADLMLKLGLLGTVVGFIIMLGSLSNLDSVDITVMQTLLSEMSGGMKVALFTTLTGMMCGIALNIKYNFLDWATDHLINDTKEKTETRILNTLN